jgi:hypothetical protein
MVISGARNRCRGLRKLTLLPLPREPTIAMRMLGTARRRPEDASFLPASSRPISTRVRMKCPTMRWRVKLMRDGAPLKPFSATTVPCSK